MYPKADLSQPKNIGSYNRLFLHLAFLVGFILTFLSTVLAYVYEDFLRILPPYPAVGPVVLTGLAGGLLILASAIGTTYLRRALSEESGGLGYVDRAFIAMLALVSITGILTLELRTSSLVGLVFVAHMGLVVTLLALLPYSKFVHLVYRWAALVKNRAEQDKYP